MRSNPLVSVVIPTYNRGGLVCEAVDSVLNQSYRRVETIVVDDGSTDDTQQRLREYGNRIRVLTQGNAGPAAARNRGIAVSNGDLVAFLDSDDLWLATKIARQVKLLEKAGGSLPCCLCNVMMRWSAGARGSFEIAGLNAPLEQGIWLNVAEVLATRPVLFNQGIAVRREVLDRVGGFDESLRLLEDHELALRISLEGPWGFIREPLVIWRETAGSLYQKFHIKETSWKELMARILEKHLLRVKNTGDETRLGPYLSRTLMGVHRELRAAEMAHRNSWAAATLARSLEIVEEYRSAIYHRTPWFPRMKAAPV